MYCSKCGAESIEGAVYCGKCGEVLTSQREAQTDPDTPDHDYLEVAVGPRNTDYYLGRFERFSSGQGFVSWNWPAFFVSLIWMLYRKMWAYAVLYFFGLPIAVFVISAVFSATMSETSAASLTLLVELVVIFVLFPMFANALYYRVVQKRVDKAKQTPVERERQLRLLAGEGGTSNAALIVVLLMIVPTIGILGAIAIPAYQDYTIRAQVTEGLNLASSLKAAVGESFFSAGFVPVNRTDAGLTGEPTDTSGKYVRSVGIDNGRIDITYGEQANQLLVGKVLSLTPYGVQEDADRWSIIWRCGLAPVPAEATHEIADYSPGDIQPKYLPSACRP